MSQLLSSQTNVRNRLAGAISNVFRRPVQVALAEPGGIVQFINIFGFPLYHKPVVDRNFLEQLF